MHIAADGSLGIGMSPPVFTTVNGARMFINGPTRFVDAAITNTAWTLMYAKTSVSGNTNSSAFAGKATIFE